MPARDYRGESLWLETAGESLAPRPRLEGDEDADVAIVGAGYTGLWTAYYLKALQPDLRVRLVEAAIAGAGASGRNGGWCTAATGGLEALLRDPERRQAGLELQRALFDTVDEVGRVCAREGIACDFAKGGALHVATAPAHVAAGRAHVDAMRALGFGERDYRWLEPEECAARVRTRVNLGGLFSPHCAALHPARLARGLAAAVERAGVAIREESPVRALEPGAVRTPHGRLRAGLVVLATEAYTRRLPGRARRLLPAHSLMIATEPLDEPTWKEIGLEQRETFGDGRRIVTYGQRTADRRIAFGARARYYLGSRIRERFRPDEAAFERVRQILISLFPLLADARISHAWGGALGIPRDWRVSVGVDRAQGLAWGGGYTGEGVAASNLVGRTLADLILARDTPLARLPWVRPYFRNWEPEPLRWLAFNGIRWMGDWLDRIELDSRRPTGAARWVYRSLVRR